MHLRLQVLLLLSRVNASSYFLSQLISPIFSIYGSNSASDRNSTTSHVHRFLMLLSLPLYSGKIVFSFGDQELRKRNLNYLKSPTSKSRFTTFLTLCSFILHRVSRRLPFVAFLSRFSFPYKDSFPFVVFYDWFVSIFFLSYSKILLCFNAFFDFWWGPYQWNFSAYRFCFSLFLYPKFSFSCSLVLACVTGPVATYMYFFSFFGRNLLFPRVSWLFWQSSHLISSQIIS